MRKVIIAMPIIHENCSSYIIFLSIGQIGQIHIALVLFVFVLLFKQFSKHKYLFFLIGCFLRIRASESSTELS